MMIAAASRVQPIVQRVTPKAASRRGPVRPQALFGGGDNKDGGGGLGGLGNMANIMENMKKAQSLVQTEAAKVQEELSQTEFDGYDEDETVKVVFLGNQSPIKCELTQAAMDCGQEELEKRLQEAMADAHAKSVTGMREKMSELAKKLGLPENMSFGQ